MSFIKLTPASLKGNLFVKASSINVLYQIDGVTKISTAGHTTIVVQESPKKIQKMLEKVSDIAKLNDLAIASQILPLVNREISGMFAEEKEAENPETVASHE